MIKKIIQLEHSKLDYYSEVMPELIRSGYFF